MSTSYTGHVPSALKNARQSSSSSSAAPVASNNRVSGDMSAFVSDPRQTKFRRSAVEILEQSHYDTNTALSQQSVTAQHFRDRTAPVRVTENHNNPAKKFFADTASNADYVNFQRQIEAFAAEDPEDYRALFSSMDLDQNGSLDKKELERALRRRNAKSQYIADNLMAHFDKNRDGKVTFEEFKAGLSKAKAQMVGSVNLKQVSGKTKPSWELKKSKEIKVVSYEERPSMAQADYTKGGFSSHPLTQGTPQATSHVPGYSGFLPSASHNSTAVGASSGASSRSDKNNLILIETYNPKVKAFTEVRYGRMKTMNAVNDRLITNHWEANAAKHAGK